MSPRRTDRLGLSGVLSHLGVIVAVSAVLGVLAAGLAIPFAGVMGIGAQSVANSIDDLPAELEAAPLPERTQFLASDGSVLATFYDENRVNVSLDEVSPMMKKAIISIEDARFYEHGALDLRGTLRAFVTNQANDGAVIQGGSSITQQMVKLTLLAQAETDEEKIAATADTYERKLNELRYAIAFEEKYSKDWILERYLNIAYFGDGAYGIQAAARNYFDVDASELNLHQSAMLAGLVRNPTGYDPTNDREAALNRRNTVLASMARVNAISDARAERASNRGLGLKPNPESDGCISSRAPFFCDYARRYLLQDESLGKTEAEREQLINGGGLTVKTTIDLRMQRAADQATADAVNPTDEAIGGLAMVQPRTGAVRALSQSRPMGRERKQGETFLNYVVDSEYGDSNGFQPGSTFKAFVLSAAIEQGISLSTQIDSPQQISIPMSRYRDCDGMYTSTEVWEPGNSTGSGRFDLYTGTQQSVNTFFAQLELRTGLCKPHALAQDMGIRLTNPDIERVPSFTLGVADVSPLEMAGAYATFAGRGLHCDNRPVSEIRTRSGEVFKTYPKTCDQVIAADTADAVNDVLRGVQEPGGFGHNAGINLNQVSAGKTGTTNDNKAVWFVGYTPNLATASMIAGANQSGQPQSLNGNIVGGETVFGAAGSTLAGPMWGQAMSTIEQFLPDRDFTTPDPTVIKGQVTTVPSVGGMGIDQATRTLRQAGFFPTVGSTVDSAYAFGTAAYTSPGGGSELGTGSSITIYVSDGTPYVAPPPPPSNGGGGNGGGNGGGDGGGGGGGGGGNDGGPGNGGGGGGPGNGGGNGGGPGGPQPPGDD